jgi:hypothetical protein
MAETKLTLEYLGTFWEWSGDLFYMTHEDGTQARVAVDSLGDTYCDIRRIPEGGYFHSEPVTSGRCLNGAAHAEQVLRAAGYGNKRVAQFAWRVRERGA